MPYVHVQDDWWYPGEQSVYVHCVKNWTLGHPAFSHDLGQLSRAIKTPWCVLINNLPPVELPALIRKAIYIYSTNNMYVQAALRSILLCERHRWECLLIGIPFHRIAAGAVAILRTSSG